MIDLKTLASKYKTDKLGHGFINAYEKEFSYFRYDTFNFLEIGVFFGSSIKMWNDYFTNAKIYGADTFEGKQGNGTIFPNADKYYKEWNNSEKGRIELIKLDQSNENQLKRFVEMCKSKNLKFKIILDDGSHLMKDQQLTFFHLFDLLEEGGMYVIEDLHTSYQSGYDVLPDKSNSTKNIFLEIKEGGIFRTSYVDNKAKCEEITKSIKDINHYYIKKGSETLFVYKK